MTRRHSRSSPSRWSSWESPFALGWASVARCMASGSRYVWWPFFCWCSLRRTHSAELACYHRFSQLGHRMCCSPGREYISCSGRAPERAPGPWGVARMTSAFEERPLGFVRARWGGCAAGNGRGMAPHLVPVRPRGQCGDRLHPHRFIPVVVRPLQNAQQGRTGVVEVLVDARAALLGVLERAHNDGDESVRVQAVAALAAWPNRHEVGRHPPTIARGAPPPARPYEAERALFER